MPIVVTVRDSTGSLAAGVSVTVAVAFTSGGNSPIGDPPLLLTPTKSLLGGTAQLTGLTDAAGRLEVWARTGFSAGTMRLRATSRFGRDSLDGAVLPGRAHHFSISLKDTSVYAAVSLAPTIIANDRANNATGPVALTARRPTVVDAAGSTITTRSPGRAYVIVSTDDARDSIGISVVPRGTLIANTHARSSGDGAAFVMFDLDGSNYRSVARASSAFNNQAPRWSDALNRVVYHDGGYPSFGIGLFTLSLDGAKAAFVPPASIGGAGMVGYPTVSADGNFVYFAASIASGGTQIWRIRSNGTDAVRVGPPTSIGLNDSEPSVSPDGRFLVYISDRNNFGTGAVRLMRLELATGLSLSLATLGTHPVWSPRGDEIAFLSGGLRVVRPDGTGEATIATGVTFDTADGQIAWSPDGAWIAGCIWGPSSGARLIALFNRSTGDVLPLSFTARENLCEATWK